MAYTKLFPEIINSTIWAAPNHVRIVWITILALRDERNEVRASVPGLAHAARVSRKDCEEALQILSDPDPDSRSIEFEGRRIEKVDGGWYVLNGEKFKRLQTEEERREYKANWMRKYRQSNKESNGVDSTWTNVNDVDKVDTVDQSRVDQSKEKNTYAQDFEEFWKEYPRKDAKQKASKAFGTLKPSKELLAILLTHLEKMKKTDKWREEAGQYIPYASSYLNGRRWEDEGAKVLTWQEEFDERRKKEGKT